MRHLLFLSMLTLFTACGTSIPGSDTNTSGVSGSDSSSTIDVDPAHNSRNAIDWEGTYSGTLQTADGGSVETTLTLYETQEFTLTRDYVDRDDSPSELGGHFEWDVDGGKIQLEGFDADREHTHYLVGENGLYQLDLEGNRVDGKLSDAYRLDRISTPLRGTDWRLEAINGSPIDRRQVKQLPYLLLSADSNEVGGNGGCNTFGGDFETAANGIKFSPLLSTKMGCPNLALEDDFFKTMSRVRKYWLLPGALRLTDENEKVILRFVAE